MSSSASSSFERRAEIASNGASATSKLNVTSELWGTGAMLGTNTNLRLDDEPIAHFEFDFVSGGSHDDDVAKFVVSIAAHTRCALDIQPLRIKGEEHLAWIRSGNERREQVHALKGTTGQVCVVNVMTGARWDITASDVLLVATDGVGIKLERGGEIIAHFACSHDEVIAFARRVAETAACALDNQVTDA